MQSNFML